MSFDGFPTGTAKFLRALKKNNDREWLKANRAAYDDDLIAPAREFVEAMGPKLRKLSKGIQYDAKIGKSVMRMNRDTRFSKDKTPYKTHLDLWFWEGAQKGWAHSGFYFRFEPPKLMLGTGIHSFDKPMLAAYRDAVANAKRGKALERALAKVREAGANLQAPHYKKVPRGYDPEHPRAELLKHNGLTAGLESKAPPEMKSAAFVDWCLGRWKLLLPVHRWLLPVADDAATRR